MGLYVQYGSYRHEPNECKVAIETELIRAEGGKSIGFKQRWNIIGELFGESQAELTSKITALTAAYSRQNQDIYLRLENGGATAHSMLTKNCRLGTQVVQFPTFPRGEGNEYANVRTYSIAVEGEIITEVGSLLSYAERITWQGSGDNDWGSVQTINGPVWQSWTDRTPVVITQEGRAVGAGAYPTPASPLWPGYEHGPSRGLSLERTTNSTERVTSWHYVFLAASALTGYPTSRAI